MSFSMLSFSSWTCSHHYIWWWYHALIWELPRQLKPSSLALTGVSHCHLQSIHWQVLVGCCCFISTILLIKQELNNDTMVIWKGFPSLEKELKAELKWRTNLSQGWDLYFLVQYKVVNPNITYAQAMLNGFCRLYVYIDAFMCINVYVTEIIKKRKSHKFKEKWEGA